MDQANQIIENDISKRAMRAAAKTLAGELSIDEAIATGINGSAVRAARTIIRWPGSSLVRAAAEAGKISLKGAMEIMRLPAEEQPEAIRERVSRPRSITGRAYKPQKGTLRTSPSRLRIEKRVTGSIAQLKNAIDMLDQFLEETNERGKWAKEISQSIVNLSTVLQKII